VEFRWKIRSLLEKPKPVPSNIMRAESSALKSLKHSRDIRILPGDKGNCTVVLNGSTYMEKLSTLLDSGFYEPVPKKNLLQKLKETCRSFYPSKNQGFVLN
jgi:hypothetical protein